MPVTHAMLLHNKTLIGWRLEHSLTENYNLNSDLSSPWLTLTVIGGMWNKWGSTKFHDGPGLLHTTQLCWKFSHTELL